MIRYLDASALVKLLVDEAESLALRSHLKRLRQPGVTSLVGVTQTSIAAARRGATTHAQAAIADTRWLRLPGHNVVGLDVTPEIAQLAARHGGTLGLRTLDAIHVATAQAIRGSLSEVVTYDTAMIAACQALELPVVSPGA